MASALRTSPAAWPPTATATATTTADRDDAAAWSGWGPPIASSSEQHDTRHTAGDERQRPPVSKNRMRRERRGRTGGFIATVYPDAGDDDSDLCVIADSADNKRHDAMARPHNDVGIGHIDDQSFAAHDDRQQQQQQRGPTGKSEPHYEGEGDDVAANVVDASNDDNDDDTTSTRQSSLRVVAAPEEAPQQEATFCGAVAVRGDAPPQGDGSSDSDDRAPERQRKERRVVRRQSQHSVVIMEGDVLTCRTGGASSTARRSARMGVYVGDGWVVHAARRRGRGGGGGDDNGRGRSRLCYDVVQQTAHDFADGRAVSADEWFRTRSEHPAAVRVRRALERVGTEWDVPDGLDEARASEDFALWAALGQSALTHADYRDERDSPPPSSSSSSSLSRHHRRHRADDGDGGVDGRVSGGGVIARAVRVGADDTPVPVLARIHQPSPSALAVSVHGHGATAPQQRSADYRHTIAGGLVGLYFLGGPIGGAVGAAAGFLLDSAAKMGTPWR